MNNSYQITNTILHEVSRNLLNRAATSANIWLLNRENIPDSFLVKVGSKARKLRQLKKFEKAAILKHGEEIIKKLKNK